MAIGYRSHAEYPSDENLRRRHGHARAPTWYHYRVLRFAHPYRHPASRAIVHPQRHAVAAVAATAQWARFASVPPRGAMGPRLPVALQFAAVAPPSPLRATIVAKERRKSLERRRARVTSES